MKTGADFEIDSQTAFSQFEDRLELFGIGSRIPCCRCLGCFFGEGTQIFVLLLAIFLWWWWWFMCSCAESFHQRSPAWYGGCSEPDMRQRMQELFWNWFWSDDNEHGGYSLGFFYWVSLRSYNPFDIWSPPLAFLPEHDLFPPRRQSSLHTTVEEVDVGVG